MKILLVYPTTLDEHDRPIKYYKAHTAPLSLGIIAALTPRQHTVKVVNDLVEEIDFSEKWDLVGLTATTAQSERAYQLAREFRHRGSKVVIGGIHPSVMPDEARPHVDSVVIGEAENLWETVVDDCERGQLREAYQNTELPDLQRAVVPRWECMDMSVYRRRWGCRYPMMPISTTRGCPYNCHFCTVTRFWGKAYRTRPIASVLSEIDGTGAHDYFFVDDNIGAKPDYARELFSALESRKLLWMSQASTTILKTPDLLEGAARAGCFALFMGIESLNKASLAGAHKSFNKVEAYEELITRMRTIGITPILSFIFGFEEDQPDQFETTLEFLVKNHVGSAVFWILTPAPGSELYEQMRRDGRLTTTRWSLYDGTHVLYKSKTWNADDLLNHYWRAFQDVYRPPGRMFRNIVWNIRSSRRKTEALFRNVFAQSFMWSKVRCREHPYSSGIGRRPL